MPYLCVRTDSGFSNKNINKEHFMKNIIKLIGIIAIAAVIIISMAGCQDGGGGNPNTYTVTFNADNGTANTTQTVTEGEKAAKPADPAKAWTGPFPAGLHTGLPDSCHFDGWQKDGTAWNFDTPVTADITLTAKWIAPNPTPIDISSEAGANIIAQAVAYINADTSGTTEYTLVLDQNITDVAAITHNKDGVTLEIISTTPVVISKGTAANGSVFTVGGTYGTGNQRSAKLVLDGSITVEGRNTNSAPAIIVGFGGSLDLKGNVKITGNTNTVQGNAAGIYGIGNSSNRVTITMSGNAEISGNKMSFTYGMVTAIGGVYLSYADFTMSGNAKIVNNNATLSGTSTDTASGGGVYIAANSTFTMSGGEISGNSCIASGTGNPSARGGGVYLTSAATARFVVTIPGVTDTTGLGAYIKDNTVEVTDGTGTATGAQVYKGGNGVFTIGGNTGATF
jgi:hypothetical protein